MAEITLQQIVWAAVIQLTADFLHPDCEIKIQLI